MYWDFLPLGMAFVLLVGWTVARNVALVRSGKVPPPLAYRAWRFCGASPVVSIVLTVVSGVAVLTATFYGLLFVMAKLFTPRPWW